MCSTINPPPLRRSPGPGGDGGVYYSRNTVGLRNTTHFFLAKKSVKDVLYLTVETSDSLCAVVHSDFSTPVSLVSDQAQCVCPVSRVSRETTHRSHSQAYTDDRAQTRDQHFEKHIQSFKLTPHRIASFSYVKDSSMLCCVAMHVHMRTRALPATVT